MFRPGSIKKIQVKNFVTYEFVEFFPGPSLNMVLGPNGTGKSTLVAAIILGLGGNPKVVGRGTKVSEYVKHECDQAEVHVSLQGDAANQTLKISRYFDNQDRTNWFIDGNKCNLKTVLECIGKYNIQVDNLCQFLPQDRVQDFAKMNKQELLIATQSALGRHDLIEKQKSLIENRERHKRLLEILDKNDQKLNEAQVNNENLEGKVQSSKRRKKYLEIIEHIDRKVAWVQYEELSHRLTTAKEDKSKALQHYTKLKDETKPLEDEIDSSKKKVTKLEQTASHLARSVRECKKTVEDNLENQEKFKRSIQRIKTELSVKMNELEESEQEINNMLKKIEELKSDQSKILGLCGNDQEVQQKVQRINEEIRKCRSKARTVEDRKEEQMNIKQNQHAESRALQNEINRLENVKQQRLDGLRRLDQQAYEAVLWLRGNRHLFKGEVFEPMMLEINVLDSKNAKFVETVIGLRDRLAFVCTDKDDVNTLVRHVRVEKRLAINVVHSERPREGALNSYQPPIPIEQLRRYGMFTYLHSLFAAPDPIMKYLFESYRVHTIPIGSHTTNGCYDALPKQIRLFFSDSTRFQIKYSQYTGEKMITQSTIGGDNSLASTLDVLKLENLRGKIAEMKRTSTFCDDELKTLDAEFNQINSRIIQLSEESKTLSNLKQQFQSIGTRIASMEQRISNMKRENVNRDQIQINAETKIKKVVIDLNKFQDEIAKALDAYAAILNKVERSDVKIESAQVRVTYLENQIGEKREQCSEAEELLNRVREAYSNVLGNAKRALQQAKSISKGLTPADPGFNVFQEMYDKLPDDPKILQSEKDQYLTKIDCLKIADDQEMNEYERTLEFIGRLKGDLETGHAEVIALEANMQQSQEEWLLPLKKLVDEINYRFASTFERMGCAGEVGISTGDNEKDYSQYALSIKVTFRNSEPLQELNNVVQSGGERAVTTAAFMLSLQELTPVPFRCVDEINQGMDANNERRIFELLIECTTQANTSQYFLVTPKLVPGLKYSKNMMVHIVHNGPFVDADKKWSTSTFCNSQGTRV